MHVINNNSNIHFIILRPLITYDATSPRQFDYEQAHDRVHKQQCEECESRIQTMMATPRKAVFIACLFVCSEPRNRRTTVLSMLIF